MVSLHAAVADNKVLHSPNYHTKDGFILAGNTICITDTDAADGVALAVESAIEIMMIISYGYIVVLLRLIVGDVSAQHEVFAEIDVAAVDVGGEQVQFGRRTDDVRVFVRTLSRPNHDVRVFFVVLAVVAEAVLVGGDADVVILAVGRSGFAEAAGLGGAAYGPEDAVLVAADGTASTSNAALAAKGVVVVGEGGFVIIVLAKYGADIIK